MPSVAPLDALGADAQSRQRQLRLLSGLMQSSMSDGVKPASSHGSTRGRLLAVLAVALAVRLVNLWLMAQLPVAEYQFRWTESDMAAHYRWSGRILQGDILSRDTARPYTAWMQEIASQETWERWWGGKAVLHKAPLYPYVLAGIRLLAGDGFWAIGLCQLALGLVNVWLTFLLANRFFGRTAATVAGIH